MSKKAYDGIGQELKPGDAVAHMYEKHSNVYAFQLREVREISNAGNIKMSSLKDSRYNSTNWCKPGKVVRVPEGTPAVYMSGLHRTMPWLRP